MLEQWLPGVNSAFTHDANRTVPSSPAIYYSFLHHGVDAMHFKYNIMHQKLVVYSYLHNNTIIH